MLDLHHEQRTGRVAVMTSARGEKNVNKKIRHPNCTLNVKHRDVIFAVVRKSWTFLITVVIGTPQFLGEWHSAVCFHEKREGCRREAVHRH